MDVRLQIEPCPTAVTLRVQRELGVSRAMAQVLVRRGLADPQQARAFLDPREEHDPRAFAGIEVALETILRHVRAANRITVHGDYDADGVCSTALLVRALRGLGADVDWYLPDRASDGYGLGEATVASLATRGTRPLYNVASGTNIANRELFTRLGKLAGCELRGVRAGPVPCPAPVSIERIQGELGWQPRGLLETLPALLGEVVPC